VNGRYPVKRERAKLIAYLLSVVDVTSNTLDLLSGDVPAEILATATEFERLEWIPPCPYCYAIILIIP
jgi:hypothetical protein